MDESGLRHWLTQKDTNPKLVSDMVCRLKKVSKDFALDFDKEYQKDGGEYLLALFDKKGLGLSEITDNSSVPVGKYSLATYKLAVKKYLAYLNESEQIRN